MQYEFKTSRRGHGSAFDRGRADAEHGRGFFPHIYPSAESPQIPVSGVPSLVAEYALGYRTADHGSAE